MIASMPTILIVEDEWAQSMLIRAMVQYVTNCRVQIAHSSADALDWIRRSNFDLVITDYNLGEACDGIQLGMMVKQMSPTTRVVLHTSANSRMLEHAARISGLDAFMPKPTTIDRLRQVFQELLSSREQTATIMPQVRINETDRAFAMQLLEKAISEHSPRHLRTIGVRSLERGSHLLGRYLIDLGYLTQEELYSALTEQRRRQHAGMPILLGDLLVEHHLLHPQVLVAVLLVQMIDRLHTAPQESQLLGEKLAREGVVSLQELAPLFEQQIWFRKAGMQVRLGDLLVEAGLSLPSRFMSLQANAC